MTAFRRRSFTLRTLFIVMTAAAVCLALASPHPIALNFAILMLCAHFVVFHGEPRRRKLADFPPAPRG